MILVYNTTTGEIQGYGTGEPPSVGGGFATLTAPDDFKYSKALWVSGGVLVERPLPPLAVGYNWDGTKWVADIEEVDVFCRDRRANLLTSSDWTQLPDVPIATKEAWATYRQALRNITDQPGYPLEVVWPEAPQ